MNGYAVSGWKQRWDFGIFDYGCRQGDNKIRSINKTSRALRAAAKEKAQ